MEVLPNGNGNSNNILTKVLSRFVTYSIVIFAITVSLPLVIKYGEMAVVSENGPVEWLQFGLLVFSAFMLFYDSRLEHCKNQQLFHLLAIVAICAAIREQDALLDIFIPIGGWQLPFILCVSIGVLIWLRNKDVLADQAKRYVCTRSFSLMWCGFIVAVPFAQLVGNGRFLELLMGDDYIRDYKRVIEELGELMGYLLIMIGSIEAIFQQKEKGNAALA